MGQRKKNKSATKASTTKAKKGKEQIMKGGSETAETNHISKDNVFWTVGLLMMAFGVFSFVSALSHVFNWTADTSLIENTVKAVDGKEMSYGNLCSGAGAYVGYLLVNKSFGLFGVLIPLALTFFGWRLFLRRELHFNYVSLSVAMLLIVGSSSLAFASLNSEKVLMWGGELGTICATEVLGWIGSFGLIMVLLVAWILTCVFINSNFINFLSSVVTKMESGVENLVTKYSQSTDENVDEKSSEGMNPLPIAAPATAVVSEAAEAAEAQATPLQPIKSVDYRLEDDIQVDIADDKTAEPTDVPIADNNVVADDDDIKLILGDDIVQKEIDVDTLLDSGVTSSSEPQLTTEGMVAENPVNIVDTIDVVGGSEATVVPPVVPMSVTKEQEKVDVEDDEITVTVIEPLHDVVSEDDVIDDLYNPLMDLKSYHKPDVRLLDNYQASQKVGDEEIYENKRRIEETLKNFGIPIMEINATVGPTITLYEIVQAQGVKIAKIQGLEKDIAQSLKSLGIRIIAPIPGRGTIGIEVPNRDKQIVSMRSSILSNEFQNCNAQLPIVIGRTIQNQSFVFDLAKMPHLLVAGATGQGKSVGLNAIIASLLYRKHPAELKFVLIDPKMVEFSIYSKLEKHFLAKMESEEDAIVTDPKRAVCVLNSLVVEMENRLQLCKQATTRNIVEYNEKFVQRRLNPNKGHRFLPYIVVIIDEFADLIMTAKEVEVPVMRLAQKARAVGIHLIIATQRPDVKVITGGIKANFPSRIAFRVMQMVDSKTIIDQPGANQLIGRGDMLFSKDGELTRIQCALIETKEVERLVKFISLQQGYSEAYALPEYNVENGGDSASSGGYDGGDGESTKAVKYDPMYADIAREIVANGRFSISSIQQTHEIGFNRAARIVRQLERDGIVGPQIGAKPREIKYYDLPSLEAKLQELGIF